MTPKSAVGPRRASDTIFAALDIEPEDTEEARLAVSDLGIDVARLAGRLKKLVADQDEEERKARIAAATAAHAVDVARLRSIAPEPQRPRQQQLALLRGHLAKVPADQVSLHFMQFEAATDDDLARLVALARHLAGAEDDS